MLVKAGDVVRLKSGGPKMTVQLIGNNGFVYCDWFNALDGVYTHHEAKFTMHQLVVAEE